MIPGVTGPGGIEKAYRAFNSFPHVLIISAPSAAFQADDRVFVRFFPRAGFTGNKVPELTGV
jgi:hypothetical protein